MIKAFLLAALLVPLATTSHATPVSAAQARAIAKEAYIYGTPMIDVYKTMYAFSINTDNPQYKGPFNTVLNISRVFTPDDTAFVTPNSDTPYTFAGLDLRTEPIVISVPPLDSNRYFVFQLMDLYTFNFSYIGTRATSNAGGDFLIAGPTWSGEAPKGITAVIRSETEFVNLVGRTQLFNPADLEAVKQIQASYKVQPLSAFLGRPAPAPAPPVDWIKPLPAKTERTSLAFFNELAFLLQFAPTPASEIELRDRFTQIGIFPGQPFDDNSLPAATREALKQGMLDGQKAIDTRRAALGGKTDTLFGSRAYLKDDFVARATGAQVGIGANSRDEALYPMYEKDASGQALDGSQHRYTLTFTKDHFPPVNAFWSLTVYDLPKQLLVKNPIDRYLVNSPMLPDLKKNPDGSLTLYLQSTPPNPDQEANWLPIPKGPFMAAMRYYWPKPELLDGSWKSPAIVRAK